jgi:hypothetical protein
MLLLYRELIGFVLEYGSVCYVGMPRTHMLLLERIQYRAMRLSMGIIGSTLNNSLGVLSGTPPLRHRLFDLNFRFLVNISQKNGHPLRDKLEKLYDLSPQKCLIPFHEVSGLDIQPEVGYTRHELGAILSTPRINRHIKVALSGVHANMYPIVAPLKLRAGIALSSLSNLFYTDGLQMDGVAGFAVHHSIDCNIGFRMRGLASVFTAELAVIRMVMNYIENEALGSYLILTDSMSSIRAMESRKISMHRVGGGGLGHIFSIPQCFLRSK